MSEPDSARRNLSQRDAVKRDALKQDLDFIAEAVRRNDVSVGVPSIYFLWAALVAIGFALPDFEPQFAGTYWLTIGLGGGLLSWWLAARDERRQGLNNRELGKRFGFHWLICGIGFVLAGLPMLTGQVSAARGASVYLLMTGLAYALAGIHLIRPMLWSGLLMLAAYAVMVMFDPPYAWSLTGLVIALALLWAGLHARAKRRVGALR